MAKIAHIVFDGDIKVTYKYCSAGHKIYAGTRKFVQWWSNGVTNMLIKQLRISIWTVSLNYYQFSQFKNKSWQNATGKYCDENMRANICRSSAGYAATTEWDDKVSYRYKYTVSAVREGCKFLTSANVTMQAGTMASCKHRWWESSHLYTADSCNASSAKKSETEERILRV